MKQEYYVNGEWVDSETISNGVKLLFDYAQSTESEYIKTLMEREVNRIISSFPTRFIMPLEQSDQECP